MRFVIYSLALIYITVNAHRTTLTFGRPPEGFLGGADTVNYTWTDPKYMVYSNITQKVDHYFGNNDTWLQRYEYNSKFYDKTNGIVFLMLGGEGRLNDKWVRNENVSMMQWAAQHKAAAFQLEHRFYGPRDYAPYNNQTADILQKYLTIDQALADIAAFIIKMNELYFNGQTTRWVTFGGSYPGSLSAFFREKYPQLTIGAVSSSSAVHVFVDYYGYAVNTEKNYEGYSAACGQRIRDGFKDMINLAYSGVAGRQQLKQTFNLCDDFNEQRITKSVQFFFQNVYGVFQGINQYSGDNRSPASDGLNIPEVCQILLNQTKTITPMASIKAVWDYYNSFYGGNGCNDNSYAKFIQTYSDTSYPDDTDIVSTRSWIWQTCTELGYFQTTDGGNNGMFGSTVPVDFFVDQCIDLFGADYTLTQTYISVHNVKTEFGAPEAYRGTNVVFPNGSLDPWKSLGLLSGFNNVDNAVDAFLINGTAHCADMYPARAADLPSLVDGRARIKKNLDTWIDQALKEKKSSTNMSILISVMAATFFKFL
ncbi:unnamed protein product [Auanema sp. JU1783]|nr:unnamed protein product [Auanema sp. JU1783]